MHNSCPRFTTPCFMVMEQGVFLLIFVKLAPFCSLDLVESKRCTNFACLNSAYAK